MSSPALKKEHPGGGVNPRLVEGLSADKERRTVKHWIEKDALKSLRNDATATHNEEPEELNNTTVEIGPRKAIVVGFGPGWTAAGINLTFGRFTTNPYPSLTISDGKHEIKAYLTGETAQSSAFWARPTLTAGSLILIDKAEFVLESTLLPPPPQPTEQLPPLTDKKDSTFVLSIRSTVQNLPRKPVLDLNRSLKYRREVEQWVVRKTGGAGAEPPEQPLEEAQIASENEDEGDKDTEEDEDDSSSSSDSSTESEDSDLEGGGKQGANLKLDEEGGEGEDQPKAAARRKHKRKLIANGEAAAAGGTPRKPPAKKRKVSGGRGRPSKLTWEDKLEILKAYKAEYQHCNAPVGYKRADFALGSWINQLRMGKGSLSDEQKQELTNMGFVWDMSEYNWQRNFEALVAFKNENGHTGVPISYKDPEGGRCLGTWVYNQRRAKRSDKLLPERRKQLNSIGFEWDVRRGKRAA